MEYDERKWKWRQAKSWRVIAHELQINVPDWNQTVRVGTTAGGGGRWAQEERIFCSSLLYFNFRCPHAYGSENNNHIITVGHVVYLLMAVSSKLSVLNASFLDGGLMDLTFKKACFSICCRDSNYTMFKLRSEASIWPMNCFPPKNLARKIVGHRHH